MSEQTEFQLSKIGNIMLGVSNMAASLPFYRDLLGMSLQFESPGFAFLDGGGVTLCLSEPLAKANDNVIGATEIVFSVEDVTQAYTNLREQGVAFQNEPRQVTPTDWAANFKDPDGHSLSIFGPAPE